MVNVVPTSKQLTLAEVRDFRAEIKNCYAMAMDKAEEEFQRGILSQSQFDNATNELIRLKLQSTKLLGLIMSRELDELLDTNADSPATRIKEATNKLQEASQRIQNFLDFLTAIAEVIRSASGMILALQTGIIAKVA